MHRVGAADPEEREVHISVLWLRALALASLALLLQQLDQDVVDGAVGVGGYEDGAARQQQRLGQETDKQVQVSRGGM